MMRFRIADLSRDLVDATAHLLLAAFRGRSDDWQDLDSARAEVVESFGADRVSRVAIDDAGAVIGWIGGISIYSGHVWEIHPLVVAEEHRNKGVGRALVADLEAIAAKNGALTLWAGSDDEDNATTLGGADLYRDVPHAIRNIRNLKRHPYEFYLRLGFKIAGVVPDANGIGKPDILLAKRISSRA
jgi:aminoglycoside 6'-N-acetyltransferase I